MTDHRSLALDLAIALAVVLCWGAGVTALIIGAGALIHPVAGLVLGVVLIYLTILAVEWNR